MEFSEGWEQRKEILIILAHPDDPDFFLGATIARWIKAGHIVRYLLLTMGDKGAADESLTPKDVMLTRIDEQNNAASVLGVTSVDFLNFEDGYLIPDLEIRKQIVREIRRYRPNILVTCDPTNYFPSPQYINHPDHRNAGQAVVEAVFPAAGNHFFFPELLDEGFMPHEVEEVWMSLTHEPDIKLDVTDQWSDRLSALKMHKSQIGEPETFEKRMLERVQQEPGEPFSYIEQFRRIKFRRKIA